MMGWESSISICQQSLSGSRAIVSWCQHHHWRHQHRHKYSTKTGYYSLLSHCSHWLLTQTFHYLRQILWLYQEPHRPNAFWLIIFQTIFWGNCSIICINFSLSRLFSTSQTPNYLKHGTRPTLRQQINNRHSLCVSFWGDWMRQSSRDWNSCWKYKWTSWSCGLYMLSLIILLLKQSLSDATRSLTCGGSRTRFVFSALWVFCTTLGRPIFRNYCTEYSLERGQQGLVVVMSITTVGWMASFWSLNSAARGW